MDRDTVYGIAYDCPALEREDDCPMNVYKDLSFYEKFKKINLLTNKEVRDICIHHEKCSLKKRHGQKKKSTKNEIKVHD